MAFGIRVAMVAMVVVVLVVAQGFRHRAKCVGGIAQFFLKMST